MYKNLINSLCFYIYMLIVAMLIVAMIVGMHAASCDIISNNI